MQAVYGAYLIRCWRDGDKVSRVEIVHIQSGEKALVYSTAEALSWIDDHRIERQPSPDWR